LAYLIEGSDKEPAPGFLRLVPQDLNSEGIPDLAGDDGRAAIEAEIAKGCDLLILDNQSTLFPSVRENEADDWAPLQGWFLSLRRRGVSVLLIHHAGKGGVQRGTSRREDALDVVMALRRPEDYRSEQGARFEVHLEKARGIVGEAARPFEAQYEVKDGAALWTTRNIEDVTLARVLSLKSEGLSLREIAEETGISKSRVQRMLAQHENGGEP
jgi:putative DNA primase/helicase